MSLNILRDVRKIYAGLNADSIRGEAWQDLNIGLLASTEATLRRMEAFLAPPFMETISRTQAIRSIHPVDGQPASRFDFVLCEPGIPVPRNGYSFESDQSDSLVRLIADENPKLELALARTFPLFRKPVSDRIVSRIARENALFSIVTALPNVVPSLIELPWALGEFATDTAFLTMNQIRMALQLAAAHGRTVGYGDQKYEIGAIAAGAFGWRALARELIGKIPLGGGLIPKAAVAYAGTYVVGIGLETANRTGSGLTRAEKREAYALAFERGKDVAKDLIPQVHT